MAEFAATNWQTIDAVKRIVTAAQAASTPAALVNELKITLLAAENYRAQRMAEIMTQTQDLGRYWADLLMITPESYPATWQLIAVGIAIGQLVGMHYKLIINRPRPVQIYPGFTPPFLTPGHPSCPNNHAFQSYLVAKFLAMAAPPLAQQLNASDVWNPDDWASEPTNPLDNMAWRIGRNRVIAGVHWPSDGVVSWHLADIYAPLIAQGTLFQGILTRAKAEWASVTGTIPLPTLG